MIKPLFEVSVTGNVVFGVSPAREFCRPSFWGFWSRAPFGGLVAGLGRGSFGVFTGVPLWGIRRFGMFWPRRGVTVARPWGILVECGLRTILWFLFAQVGLVVSSRATPGSGAHVALGISLSTRLEPSRPLRFSGAPTWVLSPPFEARRQASSAIQSVSFFWGVLVTRLLGFLLSG